VVNEIPCGDATHFLEHDFERGFKAIAGETTHVTVRIPIAQQMLSVSYKNSRRRTCGQLRTGH
jgi:hypothetical protein